MHTWLHTKVKGRLSVHALPVVLHALAQCATLCAAMAEPQAAWGGTGRVGDGGAGLGHDERAGRMVPDLLAVAPVREAQVHRRIPARQCTWRARNTNGLNADLASQALLPPPVASKLLLTTQACRWRPCWGAGLRRTVFGLAVDTQRRPRDAHSCGQAPSEAVVGVL